MSAAKQRMRSKKMRNQPSNVTYSSTAGGSSQEGRHNGKDAHFSAGQRYEPSPQMRGHGPSPSGSGNRGPDWTRGHHAGATHQEVPKYITALTFAKARASEVSAMLRAVTRKSASCHVFGSLPKHMRRRAMSHNTKRLPRRLREGARKLLEKSRQTGQKKKDLSKTKSRKARRRHGNLLLEFNRRQRKSVWLETHIWHAKRFHMVKRWGYCLGDRPTAKCYRACYRAMSHQCLLQDLSYYCCVELQGPEGVLLGALCRLTSKDTGPTFAAVHCLSGKRQGSAVLYRADRYPTEPLGPVLFLWRPRCEESAHRQLWVWAHPALKQDLLSELQMVCQCSEPTEVPLPVPVTSPAVTAPELAPASGKEPSTRKRKRRGGQVESSVPVKKLLGDGTRPPDAATSWRSSSSGIIICDLSMEVVRYRLIGPLSHMVLTEALTPASLCKSSGTTETSNLWWPEQCKDKSSVLLHQQQSQLFQLLQGVYSTADVPAGSVLGLTVDDPRLTLPSRGSKATPGVQLLQMGAKAEGEGEEERRMLILQGFPERCSQSSLWDRSVRDNVTHNKISEQELNEMKSETLVPGSRLEPVPLQGRIPLLLLHQPGKQAGEEMTSWGAGWDLLLPKGWGMAFWVPLVYRGVRIGGQQEALKHSQNKRVPHFPRDFPDCLAGARFLKEQEAELCDKYKRRPPAKRTNYIKHGCLAPFLCPWQQLVEEWEAIVRGDSDGDGPSCTPPPVPQPQEVMSRADDAVQPQQGFTVLRNRKVLQQLSIWCRPTSSRGQRSRGCVQSKQLEQLSPQSVASLSALHQGSLVWVCLSLLRKGRPALQAMICVPAAEDLELLRREPTCCGPQEPRHVDHFRSRVKRRKGCKRASSSASAPSLTLAQDTGSAPSLTLGLWPDPLPSVTSHCSRVTLGWTSQGDFSLSAGCGQALGFVSLTGLLQMLCAQPAEQRGLVLLRNPASLQYRFAKIAVEA